MPEQNEQIAGGVLGKVAGKAKEIAGEVVKNDELAREGRLQQAHVDAEIETAEEMKEAEQERAEAELAEKRAQNEAELDRIKAEKAEIEREKAIEQRRVEAEREAAQQAEQRKRVADAQAEQQERAADSFETAAARERAVAGAEVNALEREARQAELVADAVDPEEK